VAFILQGKESCFIHHLTLLCRDHNPKIRVFRNEHDGIITDKIIPKSLVVKAGKRSGLQNPMLDEKPLASKSDIAKMKETTSLYTSKK